MKDGDIVYSKDILRWKVLKIKKKISNFEIYLNTEAASVLNRKLVDKRPLKIIMKDEVFSWEYKVEEMCIRDRKWRQQMKEIEKIHQLNMV